MIGAVRALLASRKIVLLIAGLLTAGGAKLGLQLDTETVIAILGIFAVAIGGIAHEDAAKKSAPSNVAISTSAPPDPAVAKVAEQIAKEPPK